MTTIYREPNAIRALDTRDEIFALGDTMNGDDKIACIEMEIEPKLYFLIVRFSNAAGETICRKILGENDLIVYKSKEGPKRQPPVRVVRSVDSSGKEKP